jgi:hypothetical protein
MSRFEGPQGIVTNGLVLNLDAGDPDSYTRSQPPYVEVLVVAGGGGGSGNFYDDGAGGGAGGLIYNSAYQITNAAAITVTIGAGGAASTGQQGGNGGNSVFGSLNAVGGGGGAVHRNPGVLGGSGGGGCGSFVGDNRNVAGGPGTPGQGNRGGNGGIGDQPVNGGGYPGSAGGGGAGSIGGAPTGGSNNQGGSGGNGLQLSISGTPTYYAGGGGGVRDGIGGLGGGGNASNGRNGSPAQAGTTNTGGGGGGGRANPGETGVPGPGGSGIVIVRYPGLPAATGGTITYLNGYTIHTFTTSGTFTPYLWNDVSGGGNNGTLINGVGFNSYQNGGTLTFDGTNDYIDLGSDITFKTTGGWTVESVVKYDSVAGAYNNITSPANFIGADAITYNSWYWSVSNNKLALWDRSPGIWKYGSTTLQADTWYHAVLVSYDSGTSYQMYLNGVAEGGDHATYSWNVSYSGLKVRYIGRGNSSNIRLVSGNISVTKIYNRALSAKEVLQNYNAQKSRFGL